MNLSLHKTLILRIAVVLLAVILLLGWFSGGAAGGQSQLEPQSPAVTATATPDLAVATPLPGAPVVVGGQVIGYIRERIGSLLPAERAALISRRINDLATNPFAPPVELRLDETTDGTDIMAGDQILMTVTDRDAAAVGLGRQAAAQKAAAAIQAAIERTRQQNTPQARGLRWVEVLGMVVVLILVLYFINRLYHRLVRKIDEMPVEGAPIPILGGTQAYRSGRWKQTLRRLLSIVRFVIDLIIIVFLAPMVLRLFPATAIVAEQIIRLILAPLEAMWTWLIDYQSKLFTIVVIAIFTYVLIRLVRFFFSEVEQGGITIGGFEPEWASFTGRIVSFLLIVGAFVISFPYLPGSDSDAFRGISIFLGALLTFSSATAVSNIVAGVIQTYTGAFRVDDVIKIGETVGIVAEKRLLTTRVRTFKNEDVSIPNSLVLSTNVVNYTTMARGEGVILYTTVTIGYDAPWEQVHELMIAAALATPEILAEPAPFILQTSLNDFNIAYQLNCWTKSPEHMPRLYSGLHQNIQNKFNEAGVEIMSPAFTALRDGNTVTTPADNRPGSYEPPYFRVKDVGQ